MNAITRARKGGFTLVELLIVIIIIAILAGMMMLTTGSATDRAEATKIINDLRNLKAAALMYYVDNKTWPGGESATIDAGIPATGANNWVTSLEKYLDRSMDKTKYKALRIQGLTAAEKRYIGFVLSGAVNSGVKDKLKASAVEAGLYKDNNNGLYSAGDDIVVPMK